MIRRLKYHEIDFEKYAHCLENSEQRKYSASRIFLDVTANKNWEILVFNDYEAVMPIPFIRKLGVKLVVNPKLCQQLGVFSKKDDVKLNDSFFNFFEKKYNVWYYAFNDANTFSEPLKKRSNFLILPQAYEIVRQKYSPKRKRKLRLDEDVLMVSEVKTITMEEAYPFISRNLIGAKDEGDKQAYLDIFKSFSNSGRLKITAFIYKKEIINAIAVYYDEKSLALLGTFNEKDFVKLSGSSIIIDNVIKENIEDRIFDFEGSEIPSIEEFFRGFRPELRPYSVVWNSKKDLIVKILKIS